VTSYYPVALDLAGRAVLLVGGGAIAEGKVEGLLEAGAAITLVSPSVTPRLRALAGEARLTWQARAFAPADVDGAWIVIAATADRAVNAEVAAAARAAGRLVNAVDDVPNCDFIATAIVRRGDVQLSISTGGGSPAMARWLREQLDGALPPEIGDLLGALADVRGALKAAGPIPAYPVWRAAIEAVLRASPAPPPPGAVCLVGAGPGDAGLLTLRALVCVANADAVVHDQLVDESVLRLVRPDARMRYVGKVPGRHSLGQAEINQLLIDLARQGLAVVRLKGGDPFVFGRGGEEALALREAGVPFAVVPGVSSALAAPAAAGIPVTHRGHASAVTIVTGHECEAGARVDWEAHARSGATLVVLMGTRDLEAIAERLLAGGRRPEEPVALIERATRAGERVLRATLATLVEVARAADLRSPAVIVVGAVAGLHDRLAPAAPRSAAPAG
jgi:uroporphyrin-III C-methyltransferase/precorrin-2 dehydrogenase/sirohydrochlorin ferrochelatase